jgi:hypothetical protein
MDELATLIVKRARPMPVDTGIACNCNGAILAKVKVTGGVGVEVRFNGSALLFPHGAARHGMLGLYDDRAHGA